MNKNSILLSIKPIYAYKIFNGEKTIELRRKLPKNLCIGDLVLVYISSPEKKIYGAFTIKKIYEDTLDKLWKKVNKKASVTKEDFYEYFKSLSVGYGIEIDKCWNFQKPINLIKIKDCDGSFNIPQSYRYLKNKDFNLFQVKFGIVLNPS